MGAGKFRLHSQLFSGGFFMASKLVADSTKTVTSHLVGPLPFYKNFITMHAYLMNWPGVFRLESSA